MRKVSLKGYFRVLGIEGGDSATRLNRLIGLGFGVIDIINGDAALIKTGALVSSARRMILIS